MIRVAHTRGNTRRYYYELVTKRRNVSVPIRELTDRQLLLHLAETVEEQTNATNRMEKQMATLKTAISDLQNAVDGVAVRLNGLVEPLRQSLVEYQERVSALELEDATQVAELERLGAEAQAAVDEIGAQVDELNALGADPSTPVEPEPVDPEPTPEEPVDPAPAPEEPVTDPTNPTDPNAPV